MGLSLLAIVVFSARDNRQSPGHGKLLGWLCRADSKKYYKKLFFDGCIGVDFWTYFTTPGVLHGPGTEITPC
jgi:hypothetical protein